MGDDLQLGAPQADGLSSLRDEAAKASSPKASIPSAAPGSSMPRPTPWDAAIVRYAAEQIAEHICKEWDHDNLPSEWVDDLIKCKHSWSDGYRLAKELESSSYIDGDRELVDVLDEAGWMHDRAHEDAVKKWVQIVGFTPDFDVGARVQTRHGPGTVWRVEAERAQYVVATDDREWGQGGGYVLNAEDVTAQAIEARSATTAGRGPQDESAVATPCAQTPSPEQSHAD